MRKQAVGKVTAAGKVTGGERVVGKTRKSFFPYSLGKVTAAGKPESLFPKTLSPSVIRKRLSVGKVTAAEKAVCQSMQ